MKYLMIREPDGGTFPFLFVSPHTHLEIALMLQAYRHGRTILSAGFVEFESPNNPRCFGRSESMGLESRPAEDSAHLAAFVRATLMAAKALHGLPA